MTKNTEGPRIIDDDTRSEVRTSQTAEMIAEDYGNNLSGIAQTLVNTRDLTAKTIVDALKESGLLSDPQIAGVEISNSFIVSGFEQLNIELHKLSTKTLKMPTVDAVQLLLETLINGIIDIYNRLQYIEGTSEHVEMIGGIDLLLINYEGITKTRRNEKLPEAQRAIDFALERIQKPENQGALKVGVQRMEVGSLHEDVSETISGFGDGSVYLHEEFAVRINPEKPVFRMGVLFRTPKHQSTYNLDIFRKVVDQARPTLANVFAAISHRATLEEIQKPKN